MKLAYSLILALLAGTLPVQAGEPIRGVDEELGKNPGGIVTSRDNIKRPSTEEKAGQSLHKPFEIGPTDQVGSPSIFDRWDKNRKSTTLTVTVGNDAPVSSKIVEVGKPEVGTLGPAGIISTSRSDKKRPSLNAELGDNNSPIPQSRLTNVRVNAKTELK